MQRQAVLTIDNTKESNNNNLNDAVSMIDCMKKTDDDHNNIVSMVNCTEAALIVDDLMNDGNLNDDVLMINSTINDMEKCDDDFGDGISMVDATADDILSMINSTVDNVKKSNKDLGSIISMIDFIVNDIAKSNDNFSNILSMIDADAVSTHHGKELCDYRSNYDAVKDDNVDAEVVSTINDVRNNDGDFKDIVSKIDANVTSTVDDMKRSDDDSSEVVSMINTAAALTVDNTKMVVGINVVSSMQLQH